jgi:ubiquitin fusion degradation protein 1
MMKTLLLTEGELVRIDSEHLKKGSFIKIQPLSIDFLDISDPKEGKETYSLYSHCCFLA